jgi:3D (Asp-Asp-Asp) domain-containing protein
MPVVDIDINVTSADFIRQLPESLFTAVIPAGATPLTSTGKPQSNKKLATISPKRTPQEQQIIQSVSGSGARTATQVLAATPKPTPPVASILFGTLNYDGHRDKIGTVQDPGWTKSALQTLANQLSKMVKTVLVTTTLNIYLDVGNRVLARLRFADGNVFIKELFITQVDKRIDTNGPMMDLTFSWRFLDSVSAEDISDVQTTKVPALPGGLTLPGVPNLKQTTKEIGTPQNVQTSTGGTPLGAFNATAYGPPWTGIQGTGTTATGINLTANPQQYIIAVDPSVIPLHSKVRFSNNPFGNPSIVFAAEDTGGAIKGNRIDFYDWRGRASQNGWGYRPVQAYMVQRG